MEKQLYEARGFQLIEHERIELVLSEQRLQLSGLVDEDSAAEIGKLLAADTVVTGSVNRLADIVVTVLDVRSREVIFIGSQTVRREQDIPAAAKKIAAGPGGAFPVGDDVP